MVTSQDLRDGPIIITGAASGMGAACAQYFAKRGAPLVLLDANQAALDTLASDLNASAFCVDVCEAQALEKVFAHIKTLHQICRVCINCAGIAPAGRILGRNGPMALADFERVITVNLIGTFNCMRLSAALIQQSSLLGEQRGVIINTASVAAFEGQIGQAAYSASKGGVVAMTLPAAREFAEWGIRVNCIAPGLIATPMLLNMPKDVQNSLAATVPFPKRLGKPEEFAMLADHIIQNPLINGETIRLDGAIRMQPK